MSCSAPITCAGIVSAPSRSRASWRLEAASWRANASGGCGSGSRASCRAGGIDRPAFSKNASEMVEQQQLVDVLLAADLAATRAPQTSLSGAPRRRRAAKVTASVSVRMRSGADSAISCAIAPPIEYAEQVEGVELECVGQRQRVARHVGDLVVAVGHRRPAHVAVVEDDRPVARREGRHLQGPGERVGRQAITQSSGSPSPCSS